MNANEMSVGPVAEEAPMLRDKKCVQVKDHSAERKHHPCSENKILTSLARAHQLPKVDAD